MKAVKAMERSLNEALYDVGELAQYVQSGGRIPTVFDFQQVTSMSLHILWSHCVLGSKFKVNPVPIQQKGFQLFRQGILCHFKHAQTISIKTVVK